MASSKNRFHRVVITGPSTRRRRGTGSKRLARIALLSRIVERYRRLGLRVTTMSRSTRFRIEGGWIYPDFCVMTRASAVVRVGFVEPGPRVHPSRIERWLAASRSGIDVVVHCSRSVARVVEWTSCVQGIDLDIRPERV